MANLFRFYGYGSNNSINYFDFNQPTEGKKNILMWNKLLDCFMYSQDAGLTWKRVDGKRGFDLPYEIARRIDVLIPSLDDLKVSVDNEVQRIKKARHKGKKAKEILGKNLEYRLLNTILDNVTIPF